MLIDKRNRQYFSFVLIGIRKTWCLGTAEVMRISLFPIKCLLCRGLQILGYLYYPEQPSSATKVASKLIAQALVLLINCRCGRFLYVGVVQGSAHRSLEFKFSSAAQLLSESPAKICFIICLLYFNFFVFDFTMYFTKPQFAQSKHQYVFII